MILAIALAMMAPAGSDEWVLVSRNRQYTSYIDVRSVKSFGTRRRARQRVVLARAEGAIASAEYRVEVSCEAHIIALWEAVEYDRRGRVVGSRQHSQPPVRSVRPGTAGARILDFLCRPDLRSSLGDLDDPLLLLGDDPLWSEVSRNRLGTHYVDAGHVTVTGDRKTVWHRVEFAEARPNGAASVVYNVELSCGRRTIALLGGTERNWAGHVVRSRDIARPSFRAIVPNSVGERIFDYFCEPSHSR